MSHLSEDVIAAILAYLAEDSVDKDFVFGILQIVVSVIEDESKNAADLVGYTYSIDPTQIAQDWVITIPNRIRGINDVTAERIKAILQDAFSKNQTLVQVSNRIRQLFDEMNAYRAPMIARTEVLGALNYSSWAVYGLAKVPYKRWLAILDDRVRDSHAEADGQLRLLNDPFLIGGAQMMYPGDPSGPAKEVINCRCTLVPEFSNRASIWTVTHARSIYRIFLIRETSWEDKLSIAVKSCFNAQADAILSILSR